MQLVKIAPNAFISSDWDKNMQRPIALICGFMDGATKKVAKYGEIYDKLGFTVIILISKSSDIALFPIWLVHRRAAMQLKPVLMNRTIIGHLMSNGGIRSAHALDYHLGGLNFAGLILDSCPTVPGQNQNPQALRDIFYQNVQPKWLKDIVLTLFMASMRILSYFKALIPGGFVLDRQLVYITNQYPFAPRLFLYSTSDKAVDFQSVEKAMQMTKSQISAPIDSYNFENSPHVQHYVKHRELYFNRIVSFLGKFVLRGVKLKGKF